MQILIIVRNECCRDTQRASGSAIVEHNTFRFLRNMFGKMDVRPNGIRVALDTGGRQINRRLTPSACLDIRCVYEFLHTFVRDTNPERARFRNQTGLNLQPIIYDPLQAITNVYMYNQMTMFSGRTKVQISFVFRVSTRLPQNVGFVDCVFIPPTSISLECPVSPKATIPRRSRFPECWIE
uniref:Uncharacterized protein n=1 Tax=Romanomermis culicivorax TaxID=13658 RepID=A0A915J8W8_ROMCU